VLKQRCRAEHSDVNGLRLTVTGIGLFGTWIKRSLPIIITLRIYSFWVGPRIARWKWEHTHFDRVWWPNARPRVDAAPV
jgi:hypothetical protein